MLTRERHDDVPALGPLSTMPAGGRTGQLATALLDWQDWRRRVRAAETKAVYLLLAYLSIALACCWP